MFNLCKLLDLSPLKCQHDRSWRLAVVVVLKVDEGKVTNA